MRAAKTDPLLSSSMGLGASLKSFATRNKAEEQTNSTSYQALLGHFFWKSLYTDKKLRNKNVVRARPRWPQAKMLQNLEGLIWHLGTWDHDG